MEKMMSRQECESKIFDLLMEIKRVYNEYNPSGNYLALCFGEEEFVNIANRYYGEDSEKPIHYAGFGSEYKPEEKRR